MALFEWPRKVPDLNDGSGFDPLRTRNCPACGFEAKPRMTGLYRTAIAITAVFFLPIIWLTPWFAGGYSRAHALPTKALAIGLFAAILSALFRGRNGYRCANCGGILW